MPSFLHHPSQRVIEASTYQAQRYRRSSRFTELPTSSSSPQSPPQSAATPPDHPTKAPQSHTDAPDSPEPVFNDPTLTNIANMTVSEVLVWVDNNPTKAKQALEAEQQGRNRVTLTSKLRRIR